MPYVDTVVQNIQQGHLVEPTRIPTNFCLVVVPKAGQWLGLTVRRESNLPLVV